MKKNVLALVYVGLLSMSLFVLAACRATEVEAVSAAPLQTGAVYAVDAADLKLFNAAAQSAAAASQRGAVYAMDAVDLKLMNIAEASAASRIAAAHPADRKFYTNSYQAQDFDYEQSANNLAARRLAMGKYYEAHNMLTLDDFDYEQSADNLAARWLAMGKEYERLGLLNG